MCLNLFYVCTEREKTNNVRSQSIQLFRVTQIPPSFYSLFCQCSEYSSNDLLSKNRKMLGQIQFNFSPHFYRWNEFALLIDFGMIVEFRIWTHSTVDEYECWTWKSVQQRTTNRLKLLLLPSWATATTTTIERICHRNTWIILFCAGSHVDFSKAIEIFVCVCAFFSSFFKKKSHFVCWLTLDWITHKTNAHNCSQANSTNHIESIQQLLPYMVWPMGKVTRLFFQKKKSEQNKISHVVSVPTLCVCVADISSFFLVILQSSRWCPCVGPKTRKKKLLAQMLSSQVYWACIEDVNFSGAQMISCFNVTLDNLIIPFHTECMGCTLNCDIISDWTIDFTLNIVWTWRGRTRSVWMEHNARVLAD